MLANIIIDRFKLSLIFFYKIIDYILHLSIKDRLYYLKNLSKSNSSSFVSMKLSILESKNCFT
jgi:hypothetical protein